MVLARVTAFPTPDGPIDLSLEPGDIVLVSGPNGSGKTSLLRSFAGLEAPPGWRAEAVHVQGPMDAPGPCESWGQERARDIRSMPAASLPPRVALVHENAADGLVGLSVRDEAVLRGRPLPLAWAARADRAVTQLSSGARRSLALSLADAPLLLLDEPMEGLDEASTQALTQQIHHAAQRGAVVMTDHTGRLHPLANRRLALGVPSDQGPSSARAAGPSMSPVVSPASVRSVGHPCAPSHRRPPEASAATERMTGAWVCAPPALVYGVLLPPLRLGRGLHALCGPNGSGKSSLLRRLAGLHPATPETAVTILGTKRTSHGHDAPMRFLPCPAHHLLARARVADELRGLVDCEAWVGPHLWDRHPLSLSAGEAQRVALARTLLGWGAGPQVFLLDEPEAHLDAQGRRLLLEWLERARDQCVLVATHDRQILAMADSRTELGP